MYRYFKVLLIAAVIVIGLLFSMSINAGPNFKIATGRVVDSFTRELLMDVQIDILSRADSSLIATTFSKGGINAFGYKGNVAIDSVPEGGAILYLRKEGYYPRYASVPKMGKSESRIELKLIMMDRIPFFKPKQLEEVTVTTSRVKMVVKGDTIVYNADAFALAQGSMLDGLISQLPGVELKGTGQIYVNGKFVNELLVNGENFFKGDPKIALENLPAYMVKDVQVYRRNDRLERVPKEDLPLVMDVNLKKQYQTGWIANAEAGYGTSNRYLGRLFGLMFTRDSRLSLVANVNNTNDDRKPGQTDSWNPNWQSAGRAEIAKAGIDYLWNSRLRSWKIETNLMAEHKRGDLQSQQVSERYLEGGNLSGTDRSTSLSRQWRVSTNNQFTFHVPRLWVYFEPKASFVREKANNTAASTTSDAMGSLLNSLDQTSDTYRRQWEVGADLTGTWELPLTTDQLSNKFSVLWNDRRYETLTGRNLLFPQQQEMNEHQLPQEFLPERRLKIFERIKYYGEYHFSKYIHGRYHFQYAFNHNNINSTRNYYEEKEVDLPSTAERNHTLIPSKSFHYTTSESTHSAEFRFDNYFKDVNIGELQSMIALFARLGVHYAPGHINYHYQDKVMNARRNPWYFEPVISAYLGLFKLDYSYKSRLCNLLDLIDVTDSANPLYVYAGNPNLKTGHIHNVKLSFYLLTFKGLDVTASYNKYENMVAQSAYYDTTTGITTFRPENVNGNWDVAVNVNYNSQFGPENKWDISSLTDFGYQNSVDIINRDESTVRNINVGEKLSLTYKIMEGMEIGAKGNADYRRVTSPRADFATINAVDFDYGLIFRATKLPWDMSFTTDLMMHSRRGYADSRLNTNDLVWNARLAKSILNGNLTFAIDGFDILGNLSNVRLVMNSQGRTETRYNTLPRYAMLHVIYRLNLQPKKK